MFWISALYVSVHHKMAVSCLQSQLCLECTIECVVFMQSNAIFLDSYCLLATNNTAIMHANTDGWSSSWNSIVWDKKKTDPVVDSLKLYFQQSTKESWIYILSPIMDRSHIYDLLRKTCHLASRQMWIHPSHELLSLFPQGETGLSTPRCIHFLIATARWICSWEKRRKKLLIGF